ncbi:methyltransferase domain-containing protein [Kitasatospora sp. NPDC094011]|uniref:methyltransferase domain-containing protein n=1 Tax=Kitasatospora sp. NPDC094011 TaxID=3364090 RepID=UPI0037F4987F
MTSDTAHRADGTARTFYNTPETDDFYRLTWGGENIHLGIYRDGDETIRQAAQRTVESAARSVEEGLDGTSAVLDLGSGFGGAARHLAATYGCRVVALNISDRQNRGHRARNLELGLDSRIQVVTGSFNDIPAADGSFDVVWSQEAFCHSGDRARTLAEAVRVLRPGGHLVFTDLMAASPDHQEALRPFCERLRIGDLATPDFYRARLAGLGITGAAFDDLSAHVPVHYARLRDEVGRRAEELADRGGPEQLERLRTNLDHCLEACEEGLLAWGLFHGRKPAVR